MSTSPQNFVPWPFLDPTPSPSPSDVGTQSDWLVNDTQSMAFIRHKPDLTEYATETQVSELTAQVADLYNTGTQLSSAVSTLQTQMSYWIGEMNTLSGQVNTNTSSLGNLNTRYAQHGNNYDPASHRISHLL